MQPDIFASYQQSKKRLFLLDYDGTLADLMPTPPEAKPTAELIQILESLTSDPANTVVVISGRDHQTLDQWLGDLPLSFAAEHGMMIKQAGQGWQEPVIIDSSWKIAVKEMMQPYADAVPGSFLEDKAMSLAWHDRAALDPAQAQAAEQELAAKMQHYAEISGLRVIHGKNVVEVQAAGVSKGTAAKRWLDTPGWDFILAAGDDTTDEDLFAAMPSQAFTIKVGQEESHARLHVASPQEFRQLIASFINLSANSAD